MVRDFDWITPCPTDFVAGRHESASRSLSQPFAPGTKRRLGMTTRAATQDASAHISVGVSQDRVMIEAHPKEKPAPSGDDAGLVTVLSGSN
jgi:hypothetical protein